MTSSRRSPALRFVLFLLTALIVLVPSSALAHPVVEPSRAFAKPGTSIKHPARTTNHNTRPAKSSAVRPIGSATLEGQKPTASQQPAPTAPALAPAAAPASAPVASVEPPAAIPPSLVPTVDPTLAQVAQAAQAQSHDEDAQINVIVYGAGALQALGSAGATNVVELPLIDAVGGTIPASTLGELGLAADVTYVAVDAPVKSTDDGGTTPAPSMSNTSGSTATDQPTESTTTTTAPTQPTGSPAAGSSSTSEPAPPATTTTTTTPDTTTTTAATTTTAPSPPADPYDALATLFPRTSGATAAWAQGLTGQGVGVAVLDSGVKPSATDLGTPRHAGPAARTSPPSAASSTTRPGTAPSSPM